MHSDELSSVRQTHGAAQIEQVDRQALYVEALGDCQSEGCNDHPAELGGPLRRILPSLPIPTYLFRENLNFWLIRNAAARRESVQRLGKIIDLYALTDEENLLDTTVDAALTQCRAPGNRVDLHRRSVKNHNSQITWLSLDGNRDHDRCNDPTFSQ